ncbi:hypothetical protein RAJCM14343_4711 [Rhodococcus aetherivorans]|uniref:Gp28/Gp37-like domain-containing protein n=1 Tax=Rhodococcus aetherivorans TaxID=191292 RepID=A0ABQ0YSQ4_9NOCA|nr:hypothetical protein [Rhodococcus aetherivorans]ETT26238.1 hypothetical protein RR21198_3116 [Rhodococcus rhodochrous ATCC 21198]NGP25905.1 hypothetical protein [Rhodococcus aetherivorans]GES39440.1 hypothetical protein RAJCM14343_4711 [Rhodococcus aetherivorans]
MHTSKNQPRYLVYNRHKELIASITDHDKATITAKWEDIGSGTITIPGTPDPQLLTAALHVHDEPLLISVYTPSAVPWTGRVSGEYVDDGDGPVLELTLVGDRIWLDAMLAVANPDVGPSLQDRESDVREGPLETVVKGYLADAVGRLQVPVMVVPAAPDDQSPIVELSARMVTVKALTDDVLKRYGYSITARTYRVGDPLPAGVQVAPEPGTVMLDVVAGRDTGRLLWQQEHLSTFSVASTEPKAYRAYIGGKGEGVARPFSEVIDTDRRAAGANLGLPEIFVEANDENVDPLDAGRTALAAAAGGLSVNFTVVDGKPWFLGTDWELGHFAYARIAGQVFRAQITEVEMRDDAGATITYTPTCGSAAPGRPTAVADAVARLAAQIRNQNARR